jgi:hypothetical protein
MPKLNNVSSPKEVRLPGGTILNSGQLYVNRDTGVPFVSPRSDTAANIATTLGVTSNILTVGLVPIAAGTTLTQGQTYVDADTGVQFCCCEH